MKKELTREEVKEIEKRLLMKRAEFSDNYLSAVFNSIYHFKRSDDTRTAVEFVSESADYINNQALEELSTVAIEEEQGEVIASGTNEFDYKGEELTVEWYLSTTSNIKAYILNNGMFLVIVK